jgi:predicted TIM-barrel fold metal-dependent hydrolase
MPIYVGIGEFHLQTGTAANSPIVRQTVKLAVERRLYLHIHGNAEAVRVVFGYEPKVKILWAHAGMIDPPEVVAKMFDEFENLWADTSYREYAISPSDSGKLDPTWEALLLKYADRIMIGTDTWVPSRWASYEDLIKFNRRWLNRLPREVAEKIAYGNAARLFGAKPNPATATP